MMMPKFGLAAVAAVGCMAFGALAEDATKVAPSNGKDTAEKIEEDADDSILSRFTVGLETEVDSAYVYHGAVLNDRPIGTLYPYFDFDLTDDWSIGAAMYVVSDLSNRRHPEGLREWNERDYEIHTDYTLWQSEHEKEEDQWKLTIQGGYYWETFTVHGNYYDEDGKVDYRKRKDYPTIHYAIAKLKLENPFVTPFVNGYYEFVQIHSLILETGLEKSFGFDELFGNEALSDWSLDLSVTLDGGHKRFINGCYSTMDAKTGLVCGEARAAVNWEFNDYLTFTGYVAYTGLLNSRVKHDYVRQGSELADWYDHDQFVYGGLMACVEF